MQFQLNVFNSTSKLLNIPLSSAYLPVFSIWKRKCILIAKVNYRDRQMCVWDREWYWKLDGGFFFFLSCFVFYGKFELFHYITSILLTLSHQIFSIFSAFWRMESLFLASWHVVSDENPKRRVMKQACLTLKCASLS